MSPSTTRRWYTSIFKLRGKPPSCGTILYQTSFISNKYQIAPLQKKNKIVRLPNTTKTRDEPFIRLYIFYSCIVTVTFLSAAVILYPPNVPRGLEIVSKLNIIFYPSYKCQSFHMTKVTDKKKNIRSNVNARCMEMYKYILYYISAVGELGIGQMIDSFVGDSQ